MSEDGQAQYNPLLDPNFRANRSLYMEDWGTLVQPDNDQAHRYVAHSVTYGSTALQAGYILNGGALAALPPLVSSLTSAGAASIALAAIPFVLGIVFTAISSLAAYLNFQWLAHISWHDSNVTAVMLKKFYQKTADASPDPARRERFEKGVQATFWIGLIAGILSLAMFATGSAVFINLAKNNAKPQAIATTSAAHSKP